MCGPFQLLRHSPGEVSGSGRSCDTVYDENDASAPEFAHASGGEVTPEEEIALFVSTPLPNRIFRLVPPLSLLPEKEEIYLHGVASGPDPAQDQTVGPERR